MKKIFLFLTVFFFLTGNAYAKNKRPIEKPLKKKGDWSFFWNAFNHPLDFQFKSFETGMLTYAASQDRWDLLRMEPFIKMRWAVLEKYLHFYIFAGLDITRVDYQLSNFDIGGTLFSMTATLTSSGNMFFGGGVQFLLIGWKKFNFYGYMQAQITPLNDAVLDSASMTLGDSEFDLYDVTKDHISVNYKIQRYDLGMMANYRFFRWFAAYINFGYIWLNVNINLTMDEELASTVRALTGLQPRDIIPNRLGMDEKNVFGTVGLRFKIYKWLNLNLEGIIVPVPEHPIYFGQFSIVIED